jgi:hypothetical protein
MPRRKACALLLLLCAQAFLLCVFVSSSSAQEQQQQQSRQRSTSSLTSEDLLDRRATYTLAPATNSLTPSRAAAGRETVAASYYRDPSGAFALQLPSGNWRFDAKAGGQTKLLNHRSFRKVEAEGFASAAVNVYVIPSSASLSIGESANGSVAAQRALAETLAARFLSSHVSLINVEANQLGTMRGIRIIADQILARRPVVRAWINAFEREGQLFVVVCRAPLETFDQSVSDFEAIAESLAVSVTRSPARARVPNRS